MNRLIFTVILLGAVSAALGQELGPRGGRGPAPQPAPLFFKETWKDFSGNVPMTQSFVVNPDLRLNMYGTGTEDFHVTNEGNLPHIWTGLCATSCALTLSHKDSLVDLTGKAKIRWYTKTSGFHEVSSICRKCAGSSSTCPKCKPKGVCSTRWI